MTAPSHSLPLQVSFEFFPPRTPEAETTLWKSVRRLETLPAQFVSVTCGAGGTTRGLTFDVVHRIQRETSLLAAAHMTCVGVAREEIDAAVDAYWEAGIRHIVALRGDLPNGTERTEAPCDEYANAAELVSAIRRRHDFEISVAAYPGGHPESPSLEADIENLQRKLDAGATRAITQFFFDNADFLRFRERAARAGIEATLVPGIMPILNFGQIERFASKAGVEVPPSLCEAFEGLEHDALTHQQTALCLAADQVRDLVREGVREFHFYTLNRADLTYGLCHILGLRPVPASVVPEAIA